MTLIHADGNQENPATKCELLSCTKLLTKLPPKHQLLGKTSAELLHKILCTKVLEISTPRLFHYKLHLIFLLSVG